MEKLCTSFAARIVLINSVLSTLPIYFMSLFQAPLTVINKMAKVSQKKGVSVEREGGAGVVNLEVKNKAFTAQQHWRFAMERNALWRKFISVEYGSLPQQCVFDKEVVSVID